jgi:hypothetical protein
MQDWINVVGAKKHQEWLIVHVSNAEAGKVKTFLSSIGAQGSVADRIKSDISSFLAGKKERQARMN